MTAHRSGSPPEIDDVDARLLTELQSRFPIVERPYLEVGRRLDISEADVLDRIAIARERGLLRQIGPIYDTSSLGYASSLVAMRVPPDHLQVAVATVNAHPGVSHNYLRDHHFNLWFTIAMPSSAGVDQSIWKLHALSGAEATLPLPIVRRFKIGVMFDLTAGGAPQAAAYGDARNSGAGAAGASELTADDIAFVRATQEGFPDIPAPFSDVSNRLGWSVRQTISRARTLMASGHLRRIAAVLHHRRAGFGANGMAVWYVPETEIEAFGSVAAGHSEVTHCYQRPSYPDWPYNAFAMIHGRDRSEVEAVAQSISESCGIENPSVLYSSTEFKKVRLRYFTPEYDTWEERCEAAAHRPSERLAGAGSGSR